MNGQVALEGCEVDAATVSTDGVTASDGVTVRTGGVTGNTGSTMVLVAVPMSLTKLTESEYEPDAAISGSTAVYCRPAPVGSELGVPGDTTAMVLSSTDTVIFPVAEQIGSV